MFKDAWLLTSKVLHVLYMTMMWDRTMIFSTPLIWTAWITPAYLTSQSHKHWYSKGLQNLSSVSEQNKWLGVQKMCMFYSSCRATCNKNTTSHTLSHRLLLEKCFVILDVYSVCCIPPMWVKYDMQYIENVQKLQNGGWGINISEWHMKIFWPPTPSRG